MCPDSQYCCNIKMTALHWTWQVAARLKLQTRLLNVADLFRHEIGRPLSNSSKLLAGLLGNFVEISSEKAPSEYSYDLDFVSQPRLC